MAGLTEYAAQQIATLVRQYVDDAIADLRASIPAPLKGETGPKGEPGRDGKDAEPVDIDRLTSRILAMIPEPARGEKGERGERGADGINGVDGQEGEPGIDGKDGRDGLDGSNGRDGIDGKDGKDGRDGRDGKDGRDGEKGADGRDGSAIEYVTLDASKSYPRGTHAIHAGGTLYAERSTDPVSGGDFKAAGWRMLTAGISAIEAKLLTDGRTFEFAFRFTDGSVQKQQCKADVPAHRGVWREAVTYEKADVVQWSGNAWIAREVTTEKPGESKAWELLARRGRDGKDA